MPFKTFYKFYPINCPVHFWYRNSRLDRVAKHCALKCFITMKHWYFRMKKVICLFNFMLFTADWNIEIHAMTLNVMEAIWMVYLDSKNDQKLNNAKIARIANNFKYLLTNSSDARNWSRSCLNMNLRWLQFCHQTPTWEWWSAVWDQSLIGPPS